MMANMSQSCIFDEISKLSLQYHCEDREEVRDMVLGFNADVSEEARRIHKEALIIDTCTFYLEQDNWALQASGVTGLNCTVPGTKDTATEAMRCFIDYYQTARYHPDKFMIVYKADDLLEAKKQGKYGVILGAQSCDFVFHNDLYSTVELFANLGLRIMPVAYNHSTFAGDGCYAISNGGLTREGKMLIDAMERYGVTVDLSHVGERTSLEALEYCKKVPAFSHSNPRALYNHPRNISDEMAKKCAEKGGVVGVCAYPPILWDGENFPTIDTFMDCMVYFADLVGVDHVGIGIDSNAQPGAYPHRDNAYFANLNKEMGGANGMAYKSYMAGRGYLGCCTKGIGGLANFPNITEHMLRRGFHEDEIKKILGGNWLRVFRETWPNS